MSSTRLLALLYAPVIAFLAITVAASVFTDTPMADFTRDPAYSTGAHPLLGVVSNLGVLAWAAATTACLLTAAILRRRGSGRGGPGFFLCAGLLSGVLLVDDLFMVHDWFVVYRIGVHESLVFTVYGAVVAAFMIRFRAALRSADRSLFVSTLCFFAVSLAVDALPPGTLPIQHLYEDGAKLLGIVGWLAYFVRCSLRALAPARAVTEASAPPVAAGIIDRAA